MLKRTVAGILAALFGIAIIIFRDTPALVIGVAALSVLATREIEKVIGITNKAIYYISLVFSGLVVVYYEFRPELADMGIVIPTTIAFAVYCVLVFMLMLTDFEHTKFEQVASVILLIYVKVHRDILGRIIQSQCAPHISDQAVLYQTFVKCIC